MKADEWRRFCSPTVPLARLTRRVFTTADRLEADVELAHWGAAPLTKVSSRTNVTAPNRCMRFLPALPRDGRRPDRSRAVL